MSKYLACYPLGEKSENRRKKGEERAEKREERERLPSLYVY